MPEIHSEVSKITEVLCKQFKRLWIKQHRTMTHLFEQNVRFFERPFELPKSILMQLPCSSNESKRGRKSLPFTDCSESVKRLKTSELRRVYSASELCYAAQMKLREHKRVDEALLVREATCTSPTRAKQMVSSLREARQEKLVPYSKNEALAMILDANLTKAQYINIRNGARLRHSNLYPSYQNVLTAKKDCYPNCNAITVTETSIEIKLQDLLDHTTSRIIDANINKFLALSDCELQSITLTVKWGFDGSSGHSEFKQKFNFDDGTKTDSNMFVTSIVPVCAKSGDKLIFQNPRPSSTRYCRPLHIQLVNETTEISMEEKDYIDHQIAQLQPTCITKNERSIKVHYEMLMTMVDGKVCNSVTSTKSAQRCYICGATSSQMNDIEKSISRSTNNDNFQFGLSTLHAWIRFYEYFLHISYRLDIEKWQARGADRDRLLKRKQNVQKRFRIEMGLIVDKPRSGGSGTSNDGNSARRFFQNWQKSANITGLNANLLYRCKSILEALSSGLEINGSKFEEYCHETAKELVRVYPWFYLSTTVHKVLIHGAKIISSFLVPIGQLSEEAQESRNKDIKRYRLSHTRKYSRTATNTDLLNRLLESSDPLISSLRALPDKKQLSLSDDAKALLVDMDQPSTDGTEESDQDSSISSTESDDEIEDKQSSDDEVCTKLKS